MEKSMEKKRLLSIGRLSKLTGVHIQSLRYYEDLGILKPVYVDPESQYRYYTFSQMRVVEAIQYCAELDIPLKQFGEFLLEDDGQIDYSKLIEYGTVLTRQKMQRIQTRLHFLENMQQEMAHAKDCAARRLVKSAMPERFCWAIPYSGTQTGPDFHSALYRLISEVESHGMRAGYDSGLVAFYENKEAKSYIFIDIRAAEVPLGHYPQIVQIPAGEYLCAVSGESCIQKAPDIFPGLFAQPYHKTVVEVELFTEKFSYSNPVFELRCLLPQS